MLINYERKNFKLSFDNESIKFFINEKKKTVACVIEGVFQTPSLSRLIKIPPKYVSSEGVAKCHKDDIFDVERGKRIALSKAENCAYKKCMDYLQEYFNSFNDYAFEMNLFVVKAKHTVKHNETYIKTISDETHPNYKKELKKMSCGEEKVFN